MPRNFGYNFGRTEEGDKRDFDELKRRLEEQESTPPTIPDSAQPPQTGGVVPPITANPNPTNLQFWTIPDVNYRNMVGNVDIQKTLLDNGQAKTQDAWAAYSEQARTAGNFYTPDYPLFYAFLERAFDLRDDNAYKQQVEEMRTALQGLSRANWLIILTRIKYQPRGKDTIVHNYGLRDKHEISESFVGADGELPAGSNIKVYQSLLETQSPLDKIKNVFNWLNDTNSVYVWRVNSRPKSIDERVAGFGADPDGAFFGCGRSPSGAYSSLGVRFARRIAPSVAAKKGGSI